MDTNVCCRYIWGHRVQLARSVHDMSKQMYASKQYSLKAWSPLRRWLNDCKSLREHQKKMRTLTNFSRKDKVFHRVVARSLWKVTTSVNLSWGRGAVQPSVYSVIPDHEKVRDTIIEYPLG